MVSVTALWLPIVLSAVIVQLASWIIHMALKYHRSDYGKLSNEENVMAVLRAEGIAPGNYVFPWCAGPKDMSSPEMIEKYERGPVGLMHVWPSGAPQMGKYLAKWFLYCLVIGVFVAYLTGRTQGPGAEYLAVFRVAGATAFLGYAGSMAQESIWMGRRWGTTIKNTFDGLVYGLLTAGVFGWLWPQ